MRLSRVFTYAFLVFWTFVSLFPVYWLLISSFKSGPDIMERVRYLPFGDFQPTLEAWRFVLVDPAETALPRFANSFVVAATSTTLTMGVAAFAAYGLTRLTPQPARGRIIASIIATRILPPIVTVIPLYVMAQYAGLLDTRIFLSAAYAAVNLPVALWLLAPVFGSRASDQEEAALLDGATHLRIVTSVVLPMLARALFAVGLIVFILCWNEFLLADFLASDRAMTIPSWMAGQVSIKEAQTGSEEEEIAHLSAATVLMLLPLLVFTGFVQRGLQGLGRLR